MAERIPGAPQVDDPAVVADFIRSLGIRGRIGELGVADTIVPVFLIGQNPGITTTEPAPIIGVVGGTPVPVSGAGETPAFGSGDVFTTGPQTAPGAGTVLADTGALPAGTYDLRFLTSSNSNSVLTETFMVQHRNAANAANLATWEYVTILSASNNVGAITYALGYILALNERIRIINSQAGEGGTSQVAVIFARIRA